MELTDSEYICLSSFEKLILEKINKLEKLVENKNA